MLSILTDDLSGALSSVVADASLVTLIVMGIVVAAKGFATHSVAGVFGRAAAALVLMIPALFVVRGLVPAGRFSGGHWADHTMSSWQSLMGMTGQAMLGHYLVALVGVAVVFAAKSIFNRD